MKRFLLLIATVFSLTIGLGATASAETPDNFWKVDISKPAVSETKKNLNIAYNVFSIYENDNLFDVKLYQNEVEIANQVIDHPYGNSGVFTVSLPTSGTYSYQVSATITAESVNHGQAKTSSPVNVQFVDGPSPTVVTANTQTTAANGTAGTGANNGTGAGGQTNGASTNNGQVTNQAANTNNGKSLGATNTKAKATDNNSKWFALVAGIIVLLAALYYWFIYRTGRGLFNKD